ncbi:MAG TPA: alpha/beta hydrolase [Vicinamibacterales bacterium]|nr:alpha/beta hydrolase [Vicinamibacterales bacterium]
MLRILRLFALPAIIIGVLAAAALPPQRLRPSDVDRLPSKPADARITYGTDPLQFGELRLPKGNGPFPVAVVIHGGCWVSRFATLQNTAALADALRDAGIATWNVEYRRVDNPGGGWPGTFADIAAATDHVRAMARQHPVDVTRVVTIGHSAGAHLALWAAARARLPATSVLRRENPLTLRAAIALGGPGDLRDFYRYGDQICGSNVVEKLMGGGPDALPDRYAQGSPVELLPLGVPQVLIVGAEDGVMPKPSRDRYSTAATQAGDRVEVIEVPGGHFEVIAPSSAAWPTVLYTVRRLVK